MEEVLCYNRGCGQTFVPDEEDQEMELKEGEEGPCLYHPGAPFFHDAYKGWTCCNRKATDFTEFLNFKGCTRGRHSRVKPAEPEHITGNINPEVKMEVRQEVEIRKPIFENTKPRPDFDSELVEIQPKVAPSLRDQMNSVLSSFNKEKSKKESEENSEDQGVKIGESCKNSGCKKEYQRLEDNSEQCLFHPGAPIFHEGMKYWSCCQKKTSDFTSFLNQVGCQEGSHCWVKKVEGFENEVKCRYDWHQTGNNVTMAIYCKKYDPDSSYVKVNPVRLKAHIVFPEEGGNFDLDLELAGIIDCNKTKVNMMGSKVEIQMPKSDIATWSKLNFPRETANKAEVFSKEVNGAKSEPDKPPVDAINLDDLELSAGGKFTLSQEASLKME